MRSKSFWRTERNWRSIYGTDLLPYWINSSSDGSEAGCDSRTQATATGLSVIGYSTPSISGELVSHFSTAVTE